MSLCTEEQIVREARIYAAWSIDAQGPPTVSEDRGLIEDFIPDIFRWRSKLAIAAYQRRRLQHYASLLGVGLSWLVDMVEEYGDYATMSHVQSKRDERANRYGWWLYYGGRSSPSSRTRAERY